MADYSIENLIAWLETKPADEGYDWTDADNCLLGQWAAANGAHDPREISLNLAEDDTFYHIALEKIGDCYFGSALHRARSELAMRDRRASRALR